MCLKILARVQQSALEKVGDAMVVTVRNEADTVTVGGVDADVVRCKLTETAVDSNRGICLRGSRARVYTAHVP